MLSGDGQISLGHPTSQEGMFKDKEVMAIRIICDILAGIFILIMVSGLILSIYDLCKDDQILPVNQSTPFTPSDPSFRP